MDTPPGVARRTALRTIFAVPLILYASPAPALINPNYTPVDLVNQTTAIVRLELKAGADGQIKIEGLKALTGKAPPNLVLEVDRTNPTAVKLLRETLGDAAKPALLFLGDFSAAAGDRKHQIGMRVPHLGNRLDRSVEPLARHQSRHAEDQLSIDGYTEIEARSIAFRRAQRAEARGVDTGRHDRGGQCSTGRTIGLCGGIATGCDHVPRTTKHVGEALLADRK